MLQSDGENISDTWAGVGASSALLISDIPWNGPIATVRVGMIGTDFIFNPTRDQLGNCLFEMVVSGNKENIVMVEGEANEVKEEVIVDALKFAHKNILDIIALQEELASAVDITKREIPEADKDEELDRLPIPNPEQYKDWFLYFDKMDLRKHLRDIEIVMIEAALEKTDGMVSQASDALKLRRTTLIEKMKKYGISK